MFTSHPELSRGEQSVHDVIVLPHAIIDELTIPLRPDDKQRRGLSLGNAAGHLEIDLGPLIECRDPTPRRVVAFNRVAEPQSRDILTRQTIDSRHRMNIPHVRPMPGRMILCPWEDRGLAR